MNPFELLKNMQNMQQMQQSLQSKLDVIRCTGTSGAGMVEITINGKMEVQNIHIDKDIIDPEDSKTLEVLIASAFNAAVAEVQEVLKQEAIGMAGNMNIPPSFKG
ncbi:MAG: YbaB/EbfC family nucleoid-associated protein [Spirochaetia bacterium]|nr:YbaB/EbfC family nucleoid-associated protein [Spirochaetia bacterium]